METIIARQPIFNVHRRLFAYELLYRGEMDSKISQIGGDSATTALLTSAFFTEGLDRISRNKPCFVNFTEELLLSDIAENFPKNKIIIEILEDVNPTNEIIFNCKRLKNQGYILALDDFIYERRLLPLIELADIIKFDFRLTSISDIQKAQHYLSHYRIDFLAEKVETEEEFRIANKLGFKYFQGYFFARPEVIHIRELAASKLNLLNILAEINRASISQEKMVKMISADVSLSYKLLRYINSAYFYLINEIKSVTHAVALLGDLEIRRFVTLVIISKIASEKPSELLKLAAVRAKFCELLGQAARQPADGDELFLLGLFSLLHAMFNLPMEQILQKLPIAEEIKLALIKNEGPISPFLQAILSYEMQEKMKCLEALDKVGIPRDAVFDLYLSAIEFSDNFTRI
jgi:c-di-GMP-related signal transduction protein